MSQVESSASLIDRIHAMVLGMEQSLLLRIEAIERRVTAIEHGSTAPTAARCQFYRRDGEWFYRDVYGQVWRVVPLDDRSTPFRAERVA